jgi:YfiR/HmsC-like
MKLKHPLKFILVIILLQGTYSLYAQEEKYIGLFIYNFTKFFDWPDNMKTGNYNIEVLGHKSVFDELTRLTSGKSVGSQTIVIKNLNTVDQLTNSHILFVGHWQSRSMSNILAKINGNNTLIISESEGMLDAGSAINFVIRDNGIKFEINLSNARKKGLKVDPRIRELACKVVE